MVFVLGDIDYYSRHGFIKDAEKLGFSPPYPILEKHRDAWMVQVLSSNVLGKIKGNVLCADSLNKPEYLKE